MKVSYQGRQVDATVVDFITRREEFNEYQLIDGGIVKIKLVVTQIVRLDNEKDPEGSPLYNIRSSNVVAPME